MADTGIPYSDYGEYRGIDIGSQRSILAVAERGIWYWNGYVRKRPQEQAILLSYDWEKWPVNRDYDPTCADQATSMLLNCADWLLQRISRRDGFSVWEYSYPFSYGTAPGWRSAHAQAVGIQLLSRAGEMSRGSRYLEPIDELLAAFPVPVQQGGLSTRTDTNAIWFEKMADANNQQPKVLNGMLFALLGLIDIAEREENHEAGRLAETGLASVRSQLPRFDLGDWSAYDIMGRRASSHYHRIHIAQLSRLYEITNDPVFAAWRDKFTGYAA